MLKKVRQLNILEMFLPSSKICCIAIAKSSPQCLKITGKVSFYIASEASYVYIISGQKFKNAKNGPFWRVFENLKFLSNSVTRQVNFNRTKFGEKFKCDIFSNFQTCSLKM